MQVTLPWMTIVIMTIACFAFSSIWHGPIFGKMWMRIHHGKDSFSETEMKSAMVGMWKLMVTEFIATFFMVMTLAFLMKILPSSYSGIHVAFLVWIGFILPTMTSTVIWGGDKKNVMCMKIAISSIGRLIGLLASAYVLSM